MKVNYLTLLAGATLVLLSAAARADQSAASALADPEYRVPDTNAVPATTVALATTASTAPGTMNSGSSYRTDDTATYNQDSDPVQDFIARAGVWAVHSSGSQTEVGQYQNVRQSSPFFDLDGIHSDGDRTFDLSLIGTDNDTDDARLHYFGPSVEANIDYQRFDHQLYQDSYAGWTTIAGANSTPGNNFNVMSHDNLSPGTDYAMRVQDYKANFHGQVTDNLKWYVNTFGMEKEGEQQANAVAHCYTATPATTGTYPAPFTNTGGPAHNQCHAVSQAQHIDWKTNEVEAGLELRLGALTINYSHMVRDFDASGDQQVYNLYATGSSGYPIAAATYSLAGYNIVPNSLTQMDRLKASADLGCDTNAYVLGYLGDTTDQLNWMNRHYSGGDLRITNKSIKNLAVTAYAKAYADHTDNQSETLNSLYPASAPFFQQGTLPGAPPGSGDPGPSTLASGVNANWQPQIGRDREAVGFDTRWRPFEDDCNMLRRNFAVVSGYEYATEHYQNATYYILGGTTPYTAPSASPGYPYTQPDTIKNTYFVGLEEKWSAEFQSFVRYKYITTDYPFVGVTPEDYWQATALDSALPQRESRLEIGGTWTLCDRFMLNGELYVENSSSDGFGYAPFATFNTNSVPFVLSAWWAPTPCWSVNAGYAELNSSINQDIALSALNAPYTGTGGTNPTPSPYPSTFANRSEVVNLGARYAWTPKLSTCAEFEYVYALNATSIPVAAGGGYNLGTYSLVDSETIRVSVGVDYRWQCNMSMFARYNYYNFLDLTPVPVTGGTSGAINTNMSGQTNMFLVGMSGKF